MVGDLKPGDVTTLGALRPGDVARYLVNDDEPGTEFVVELLGAAVYLRHPNMFKSHYRKDDSSMVRYLGRGRVEPARIVMEGEADRVAELEAQVRTLREACEKYLWHFSDLDEVLTGKLSVTARNVTRAIQDALAATAPKGETCTPAAPGEGGDVQ